MAKKTQLALPDEAAESLTSTPSPQEERDERSSPGENGREPPPVSAPPLGLEERVRRLEDIIAGMQHSQAAVPETPPQPSPETPAAEPPPVSSEDVQHPLPASPSWLSPEMFPSRHWPPRWLLLEMLAEFRAMIRMYLDPRYRLTWQTRLLPLLILLGMVLSWWLIAGIPVIGFLLDRVIFLVLAYALFKVLTREATRYRMTSPDIPPSMRL